MYGGLLRGSMAAEDTLGARQRRDLSALEAAWADEDRRLARQRQAEADALTRERMDWAREDRRTERDERARSQQRQAEADALTRERMDWAREDRSADPRRKAMQGIGGLALGLIQGQTMDQLSQYIDPKHRQRIHDVRLTSDGALQGVDPEGRQVFAVPPEHVRAAMAMAQGQAVDPQQLRPPEPTPEQALQQRALSGLGGFVLDAYTGAGLEALRKRLPEDQRSRLADVRVGDDGAVSALDEAGKPIFSVPARQAQAMAAAAQGRPVDFAAAAPKPPDPLKVLEMLGEVDPATQQPVYTGPMRDYLRSMVPGLPVRDAGPPDPRVLDAQLSKTYTKYWEAFQTAATGTGWWNMRGLSPREKKRLDRLWKDVGLPEELLYLAPHRRGEPQPVDAVTGAAPVGSAQPSTALDAATGTAPIGASAPSTARDAALSAMALAGVGHIAFAPPVRSAAPGRAAGEKPDDVSAEVRRLLGR